MTRISTEQLTVVSFEAARRAIAVLVICGSGTVSTFFPKLCAGEEERVKPPLTENEFNILVDGLASRNASAPKFETVKGVRTLRIPVFPDSFDFAEQVRVSGQLNALMHSKNGDVWPWLVKRISDDRYSATMFEYDNDAVYNQTVGDWCKMLAERDLFSAYSQPPTPGLETQGQFWVAWHPNDKPKPLSKEWLGAREGKLLWELQLEQCQWVISEAPGLKLLNEEARNDFISKIKTEIERLNRTHDPSINKRRPGVDNLEFISEDRAKRLLKKLPSKDK